MIQVSFRSSASLWLSLSLSLSLITYKMNVVMKRSLLFISSFHSRSLSLFFSLLKVLLSVHRVLHRFHHAIWQSFPVTVNGEASNRQPSASNTMLYVHHHHRFDPASLSIFCLCSKSATPGPGQYQTVRPLHKQLERTSDSKRGSGGFASRVGQDQSFRVLHHRFCWQSKRDGSMSGASSAPAPTTYNVTHALGFDRNDRDHHKVSSMFQKPIVERSSSAKTAHPAPNQYDVRLLTWILEFNGSFHFGLDYTRCQTSDKSQ